MKTLGQPKRRFHASEMRQYMIEGEYVSIHDIAQRTGISTKAAWARLERAQALDGPVTWARLGAIDFPESTRMLNTG